MTQGYKNFADDVKLAFEKYLKDGVLNIKHEHWFENEICYSVVLESRSQYLDLSVENLSLVVYLIDKDTLEYILLDELLMFLYEEKDFKKEKLEYSYNNYFESAKAQGKSQKEQIAVGMDHVCLGSLNAYATLIETYLSDAILGEDFNWTEKMKQAGKILPIYKSGQV